MKLQAGRMSLSLETKQEWKTPMTDQSASVPQGIAGLDLKRVYEYRFENIEQSQRENAWKVIARAIGASFFPKDATRLLDPAAGRGEFISNVVASERWAVDLVDQMPDAAKKDVKFIEGDVLSVKLPLGYFDGVFVSNFLEHLESPGHIQKFLKRIHSLLREGGHLVIMGPNFKYAFKEYFDCADHLLPLTDNSVAEHLYAAGFKIERQIPKFLPYSFRSRLPSSPFLIALYLRLPFVWGIFGKQFLMVGKR